MKTIYVNEPARNWYVIDAADKPLGRVAAKAASVLRGKNKVIYAPHQENGDYVIIINAEKVKVTGRKATEKLYQHHTGFVGGLKTYTFEKKLEKHPEDPITIAVKGMLPHGPLGRKLLSNMKVYAGAEYEHAAQNPQALDV
ncbi:MAG: 50S ribosomal protein L13 [Treponemataceae bacterium]|nr:50S ribosomal protein L13 [Treponemataceae bacterium]